MDKGSRIKVKGSRRMALPQYAGFHVLILYIKQFNSRRIKKAGLRAQVSKNDGEREKNFGGCSILIIAFF
jgi:hypothetical protein